MSEKPILMCGEMVRATLEGRKTQTRRVVKDGRLSPKVTQIELLDFLGGGGKREGTGSLNDGEGLRVSFVRDCEREDDDGRRYKYTGLLVQSEAVPEDGSEEIVCPYGVPGDRLWVKETFRFWEDMFCYRADGAEENTKRPWKPSIFMPRAASRITLEITSVQAERLRDISMPDVLAEGCILSTSKTEPLDYQNLWDSINGEKHPWSSNPWVWVIAFKLCPAGQSQSPLNGMKNPLLHVGSKECGSGGRAIL